MNYTQKISIVIPSFNGKHLLAKNLPRICQYFSENEIIVVDDGSQDRTIDLLSKRFPKVRWFRNGTNLGFSSTANKGIKEAKSPLVFLLNNDCFPESNFLFRIIPYFEDRKTFAVSCLEKTDNILRGRGIGGFKKGLFYHQPGNLVKNNTLWVFGASAIYRKKVFEELGGFDENYNPFYWEDFDLSYRALKSGYQIFFEKKAIIHHQGSATINQYYSNKKIQPISFRNQIFTVWKNLSDRRLWLNHCLWLPYHLLWTTIKTNGAFLLGFLMAVSKITKILEKRKANHFLVSDREVLAPFQKELI